MCGRRFDATLEGMTNAPDRMNVTRRQAGTTQVRVLDAHDPNSRVGRPGGVGGASRQQLVIAADALTDEFRDLPAGVVRRCFARAVREARLAAVPPVAVVVEAERIARVLLELRTRSSHQAWSRVEP